MIKLFSFLFRIFKKKKKDELPVFWIPDYYNPGLIHAVILEEMKKVVCVDKECYGVFFEHHGEEYTLLLPSDLFHRAMEARRIIKEHWSNEKKLEWLKQNDLTEEQIEVANYIGTTEEMQDYICQNRPDLINRIVKLFPKLKEKYSHELELVSIDI